jgi:hypothetical protein
MEILQTYRELFNIIIILHAYPFLWKQNVLTSLEMSAADGHLELIRD